MQFLNDKFFRVAVILFFLLMALPFMFSEPEPEKKEPKILNKWKKWLNNLMNDVVE